MHSLYHLQTNNLQAIYHSFDTLSQSIGFYQKESIKVLYKVIPNFYSTFSLLSTYDCQCVKRSLSM